MYGQKNYIGSFIWPFVRYDVLMPQQVRTDLFEWLYLSLVVNQNEQRNLDKRSYTKEVKDDVRCIIKQRFSSLLDDVVIDNIISTAEKEFVVKDMARKSSYECLAEKTFGFLDTYEDLFSSQVTVRRVFHDGICGGVVPCFKDDMFVKDANGKHECELHLLVKDKPTQEQIKKAYSLYNRLNSAICAQEEILGEEDEFYDEDVEVDFEPEIKEFEPMRETDKSNMATNFSTYFIDNSRCEFKLEIGVYSDGEMLSIDTPFDSDVTFKWMNKRLPKARSVCEELDKYLKELEAKHTAIKVADRISQPLQFVCQKGVAEQLAKCGDIYRLIERLPEQFNDLKKILIDVDKQFASKHKSYFNSLGTYLECLLEQFVDRTDIAARQHYDYYQYCSALTYTCSALAVSERPFLSENIFKAWHSGWVHFKADLASVFLTNTKMRSNTKMYSTFVRDIFDLYDKRNEGSHYKPTITYTYDEADIIKLFNVTRVLIELI